MKDSDWKFKSRIEKRYFKQINQFTQSVKVIVKQAKRVEQIVAGIERLAKTKAWKIIAEQAATDMVRSLSVANAATWRQAAAKSQNGFKIYQALKAEMVNNSALNQILEQNAGLISSLPGKIAEEVSLKASTLAIQGQRPDEVLKSIQAYAPRLSESRARLIARTETAKAQSAITQVRSQAAGLRWYVWRTSEDQRVRSSHAHMEGVLCQFDNPPSPEQLSGEQAHGHYGPGEIFNCRCYAEPAVSTDLISFPAKIVLNGQIKRINKKEFEALE